MTITVKGVLRGIIEEFSLEDIDVDLIEKINGNIGRAEIVSGLKALEEEGYGVFLIGRRGKKSRFIKGAKRVEPTLNKEALSKLKEYIMSLNDKDSILLSFDDSEKKASNSNDNIEEFRNKLDIVSFFGGDIFKGVEACKFLQKEGIGRFVIGRRGRFSRFIKGLEKSESMPKGIIQDKVVIDNPPKYSVVNNIIIKGNSGIYSSIEEAIINTNIEADISIVREAIDMNGYFG